MKTIHEILQELMSSAEIEDYLDLSRKSGVSEWQFYRLEHNLLDNIPLGVWKKIASTLGIDVLTLIQCLDSETQPTLLSDK